MRAIASAFAVATALIAAVSGPLAANPALAQGDAVRAQVEAGGLLFASSCANCHGSAGKGAIGPALADLGLSADLIRNTVMNGRVGTPMPPFKDDLDGKSQAQILAYVQWITSAGRMPTAIVSSEPPAGAGAAEILAQPVAVGPDTGIPARGAALFFDPTRICSCRTCHSYAGKGGPVGPDLSSARRTPLEIFHSISRPHVAADAFPAVALELYDGSRITGIKSEEAEGFIRLFDVASLPPVRRSIRRSGIKTLTASTDSGIYDHTALPYTRQDLLDLSAYLGR